MNESSKIFTVMVVGDNPEELMEQYNINHKVTQYCKYKYLDAPKLRAKAILLMKELLNNIDKLSLGQFHVDYFTNKLQDLEGMSDFEYYQELTQGLTYDENGDAWSSENPNGKWTTCKIGDFLSVPLPLKDNTQTHQAFNKDIDWDKIHMFDKELYEITWDLVHGLRTPINEQEEKILKNMSPQTNYFASFPNKEAYVVHNSAYWNYAFLDKNGWVDIDSAESQQKWITEYYDRFINNLQPNDKVTIFECHK